MKSTVPQRKPAKYVVTGLAGLLAAVHLIAPDVSIDGITVGLLLVAVVPWLDSVFEAIEFPGGWKVQYQKIKEEVQDARGAAESAEQKAAVAIAGLDHPAPAGPGDASSRPPVAIMEDLAQQYDELRVHQAPGARRTAEMTRIVRALIELAPSLAEVDVAPLLAGEDAGFRLAGYAYLYSRPDPRCLQLLVEALTTNEAPFGQYWAIQAVDRILAAAGPTIDEDALNRLVQFRSGLPPDSDRYYELTRVLGALSESTQA